MPKLRFSSFKGEWKKTELKDILKVNSGKDYKHLNQGEIPVYGTGGYMLSVDKPLSKEDAVGIGRKGSIDKPQRLKAPFWTVDTLFYCTPKNDSDLHFLFTLFNTINWKMYDESTGVPSLSKATIEKIGHYVPCNREQKKIGKFFELIDLKIQRQQEKVDAWREYKKGMVQKIFSRELRFKDEDGQEFPEWEYTNLSEYSSVQGGFAFKSTLFKKIGIPIVRISNIIDTNSSSDNYVYYPEDIAIDSKFIVRKNDLLIAMSGATTGKTGVYGNDFPSYLNQRVGLFKGNSNLYYPYLIPLVESHIFKNELKTLLVAGAQPNISPTDIQSINLPFPCLSEQRKIGDFIYVIDQKIMKEESKVVYLQEQKQGFMQQMFI